MLLKTPVFHLLAIISLSSSQLLSIQAPQKLIYEHPIRHESLSELLEFYYTRQETNAGCSLATATMVINALLRWQDPNFQNPFKQRQVLAKSDNPLWERAVQEDGPGFSLLEFFELWPSLLRIFCLQGWRAQLHYVQDQRPPTASELHKHLRLLTKDSPSPIVIIANFDQSVYVPVESVGHFSPLADYRLHKPDARVLDVDDTLTGPYRVAEDILLEGMNTQDMDAPGPIKYRGYIVLKHDSLQMD